MTEIFNPTTDEFEWINVDDPVMGGISKSDTRVVDRSKHGPALVFSGEVSLENNGGFCSTRTEGHEWNLAADVTAIELEARGDGKSYKFTVRTDEHDQGSYRHEFDTRAGSVEMYVFALEDFEMYRRGTHLPDAPPLDVATIRSIGILISDGQAGEFELEIFRIGAR